MQSCAWTFNPAQQIFLVLYAVMWAGTLTALSRWKAFDTGAMGGYGDPWARRRLRWASLSLNVVPVFYAAFILLLLRTRFWGEEGPWLWDGMRAIVASFPALGVHCLYRIWLWRVQRNAQRFYPLNLDPAEWRFRFPGLRLFREESQDRDRSDGDLDPQHACANLGLGLWYYMFYPCTPLLLVDIAWLLLAL